jgi:glycosyltransferase involved in cell wall biosynthesis
MISVVIPTHKPNIKLLRMALQALATQSLDKDKYEVILVENPDFTEEVQDIVYDFTNKMRISRISSSLGSNNARNEGIEHSQYDLIALMDDDCAPNVSWLARLVSLRGVYPEAGVIAGPLLLDYVDIPRPFWLTGDLEYLLSRVYWDNPPTVPYGPFDLKGHLDNTWIVSANLCFTKERWKAVGGFNGDIGYHGLSHRIGNDELEFVINCSKLGKIEILYDNALMVQHLIPKDRCNIDYLIKRAYGQGFADAVMWQQNNPTKLVGDFYHDYLQNKLFEVSRLSVQEVREDLKQEDNTRLYLTNVIKCKTSYLVGAQHSILGEDPWQKLNQL